MYKVFWFTCPHNFFQGVRPEALEKVEIAEIREIIQHCIETKKDER